MRIAKDIQPAMDGGSPEKAERLTVFFPMAGDVMGGSHVSLLGLLEGLDQTEIRIIIGPEVPDGRLATHYSAFEQIPDPVPPERPFVAGQPFNLRHAMATLKGLRRRTAFIKENNIDIVHTNDGRTHATWAIAAKLAGKKLVWHHRGNPTARGVNQLAPLVADSLVTVSSFAIPEVWRKSSKRANVIHSPFDVSITVNRKEMRRRILDEFGFSEETIICGYFGTYIDRKRPLTFVDTVLELSLVSQKPVKGLLFGEPTNLEEKEALASKIAQTGRAVLDAGYRTPGHIWLGGCDLLLVPAIDEPLGRTLVEAMLIGTPVIATHSGGNPEALCGNCGVLVEDLQAKSLADAALALFNDTPRKDEMVLRAQESARERFSRERHVSQVREIYRELTGR